jgi:beta-fructofuranosidase
VMPKNADGTIPGIRHWDPDCWLNGETFYALSGGGNPQLMRSTDLENWSYLGHVLHQDFPADLGVAKGEDISCANMFKIGDKWMLLCISHRLGCRYYLGDFQNEKYLPEFHAMMNWKAWHFFAPESLLTPDGRRVMWAWCKLDQPGMRTAIQSLPRELSLPEDGVLRIKPLKELETLRFEEKTETDLEVPAGAPVVLQQIAGDVLELEIKVDPSAATKFGIHVFCDKENKPGLPISISPGDQTLQLGDVKAPFELPKDEPVTLRVFLDKAMVEVFANDRQAMVSALTHPAENVGISIFSEGADVKVPSLRAWKMNPPMTAENCKAKLGE